MNKLHDISSCFSKLAPEELALLNNKKTQITYLKGETIIKQGAFASHVIFVNDGLLRKYVQSGNQKQVNLQLVKTGDFMAFFSIFGEAVYPFSAIAIKETTICMIDKEAMKDLLINNPAFALEMTSRNYSREHRYLEIINNISYKQMRGKLASALLYLSSEEYANEDVFNYLTRQEIADFASITIESAIKFIKEFEKEAVLKLDGKKIVIQNREELDQISRIG